MLCSLVFREVRLLFQGLSDGELGPCCCETFADSDCSGKTVIVSANMGEGLRSSKFRVKHCQNSQTRTLSSMSVVESVVTVSIAALAVSVILNYV
jgi:hypothetical protein